MKKSFLGLSIIFGLFLMIISCWNEELSIKSIYIKAANEDVFDKKANSKVYYYNTQKNDKLILNLFLNKDEKLSEILGSKTPKIQWYYHTSDNIEKSIDLWENAIGEKVAEKDECNLIIDISAIDILEDYTVIAAIGELRSKYNFSIDTKKDIASSVSLFYIPTLSSEIKDENKIIIKGDTTHLNLISGASYVLKLDKDGENSFGTIEFENKSPKTILLCDNKDETVINDKLTKNSACINITGKAGDDGLVEIKAGNKKIANVFIKIDSEHPTLISLDPPIVEAQAIENGYKFIFKASNNEIFENYALMLSVDDNQAFQITDEYYNSDKFEGMCYNYTEKGAHKIKAYFQNQNLCSRAFENSFVLTHDNLLDSLDDNINLNVDDKEKTNDLAIWEKEDICKKIKLVLPSGNEYRPLPFSENSYFYPYKKANARITISADDVQYFDIPLNFNSPTEWNYDIPDGLLCDEITLKVNIYNVFGKTGGVEKEFKIPNKKFALNAKYVYLADSDENNKSHYGIMIDELFVQNSAQKEASNFDCLDDNKVYIAYIISQDGGKTFSDVKLHLIEKKGLLEQKPDNFSYLFTFPTSYEKNSDDVVIKAKLIAKGINSYTFQDMRPSSLKACEAARVEFNSSVQDAPNVKKVKITSPQATGYEIFYLINNGSAPDENSSWIKLDIPSGQNHKIIDAIRYNSAEGTTQITKTLWVKTFKKTEENIAPSLNSYKITLNKAPRPINNKSDGALWRNRGFWHGGIAIMLTAPVDNCYIKATGETENVHSTKLLYFKNKGDETEFVSDFDQCFAAYRYNRFFVACYISVAGFIDSEIDEYCGYERSNYSNDFKWCHNKAQKGIEELKKTWRKTYAF